MLFAQMAVSAYACPRMNDMAAFESAMTNDDGQSGDSNLCEQHCQDGKASAQAAKPFPATHFLLGPALRVPSFDFVARVGRSIASPLDVAAKPPPLIRYTVLRI